MTHLYLLRIVTANCFLGFYFDDSFATIALNNGYEIELTEISGGDYRMRLEFVKSKSISFYLAIFLSGKTVHIKLEQNCFR